MIDCYLGSSMPPFTQPPNEPRNEMSFKAQLDQAARDARNLNDRGTGQSSLANKITEYLPAATNLLGTGSQKKPEERSSRYIPGPPDRPHHDEHIEEFVRDQHRSRRQDGSLVA
ncbi:hypothetical protein F5B20DRAFT_333469 [Whalleya microplaca]|nr:hypothetical protein F5B20DRAFT_333469 [Whalleya microplaca]